MEAVATKSKNRASISLSLDWDRIFQKGIFTSSASHVTETITYSQSKVRFCTGSSYTGQWNILGMNSTGKYVYPYKCEYFGKFRDGMFHGKGVLNYPMGQKLVGHWHRGKLTSYKFYYADGKEVEGGYCRMPDRRFLIELQQGFRPATREYLTNEPAARAIPAGCYDTGDGFYDPESNCVTLSEEARGGAVEEHEPWRRTRTHAMVPRRRAEWIRAACRRAWDEPAGYRPDLFEEWATGRGREVEEMDRKYRRGNEARESVSVKAVTKGHRKTGTPIMTYVVSNRVIPATSEISLNYTLSGNIEDFE